MSVIEVQKLLQEISPKAPSGENLEYDRDFVEMVRAAQGKPEQQVGGAVVPAEEPNWREVKTKALQLLARSKDLRLGVYVARAMLRTDGFAGLEDGLALLRGLLEKHWGTIHPQLDPDDDNDPTMRVNTLVALCHPETMLRSIRESPLVASRAHGRISLRDVLIATGKLPPPPAGQPATPESATIDAAFRECELDSLQATADAVGRSIENAEGIEAVLTEKVGATRAADFSELTNALRGAQKVLAERLGRRGVVIAGGAGEAAGAVAAGTDGAAQGALGDVNSREDAIRVLDRVCDYFAKNEPSSPVPLLLRRAKRLISKNFVEIMRDLAPDALTQVDNIRGSGGDES
jgi:type VI secretion system protein ImpA